MDMYASLNSIKARSLVDGPGERVAVFFQGCTIHCKGCQNKHLWKQEEGTVANVTELAVTIGLLASNHGNVTISGGEPFNQPRALAQLVTLLRHNPDVKHIIVYSGYTWEQLTHPVIPSWPWVREVLERIDVVVDGPFKAEEDDPFITYRGSRNQRPIDVPATIEAGKVVTLDWNNPEIVLDASGNAFMPVGLADELSELGKPAKTRMCGQTR